MRKDNIFGRSKMRLELREEHLVDPIVALDKVLYCSRAADDLWLRVGSSW